MSNPTLSDPYIRHLLQISDEEAERLKAAEHAGVIEFAPVTLPDPEERNNHLGWPVSALVDDTLVVVHRHIPRHWKGSTETDDTTSFSWVVRSTDGGQTWSTPYDLRDAMSKEDRYRGGHIPLSHRYKFATEQDPDLGYKLHLNSMVATPDGGVVVACNYGIFRSDDKGKTWEHFPEAFREDTMPGPIVYLGPKAFNHPDRGIVLVGHSAIGLYPHDVERSTNSSVIDDFLHVRWSLDGGRTWEAQDEPMPSVVKPGEPCPLWHDGNFIIIARSYDDASVTVIDGEECMRYIQLWSRDGWFPFEHRHTTIRVAGKETGWGTQDTMDVDFNPVSGRLEVVTPNRAGGGPGSLEDGRQTLNLWSIDAEAMLSGDADWSFEGTLLRRADAKRTVDGMHPGGAVIDRERGMQHIFIYLGFPEGPAGAFRLSRTLDTDALREYLI
jgi:hypothetical protein